MVIVVASNKSVVIAIWDVPTTCVSTLITTTTTTIATAIIASVPNTTTTTPPVHHRGITAGCLGGRMKAHTRRVRGGTCGSKGGGVGRGVVTVLLIVFFIFCLIVGNDPFFFPFSSSPPSQ